MFDDEALEASTVLLFSLLHFLYCPIAHAPGKHGIRASALQLSWAARCVMCSSAALVGPGAGRESKTVRVGGLKCWDICFEPPSLFLPHPCRCWWARAPRRAIPCLWAARTAGSSVVNNHPCPMQVLVGPGAGKESDNAFVGGQNRWRYDTFVNWEYWWPAFPVLVYFKVGAGCCCCWLVRLLMSTAVHTATPACHVLVGAGDADEAGGPDPLLPHHHGR